MTDIARPNASIGDVFEKWTIVSKPFYVHNGHCNRSYVKCRCLCGSERDIVLTYLINGKKSIGCYNCFRNKKCKGTLAVDGKKTCASCHRELSIDNFCKQKVTLDGLRPSCKECCYFKDIKRDYNLSRNEYEELFRKQDGRCAICREPPNYQRLHIDHCHTTGEVRGLLCGNCNRAFGLMKESSSVFLNAAQYAGKWEETKEGFQKS